MCYELGDHPWDAACLGIMAVLVVYDIILDTGDSLDVSLVGRRRAAPSGYREYTGPGQEETARLTDPDGKA